MFLEGPGELPSIIALIITNKGFTSESLEISKIDPVLLYKADARSEELLKWLVTLLIN